MSRPRIPTQILELRGAFKHDPARGRARALEPRPDGLIGDPPLYFTADLKGIWAEIVQSVPEGVLTSADNFAVEIAAGLLLRFRKYMKGELYAMPASEIAQLHNLLGKFGCTPSDRSKLSVPKKEESKENDELSFLTQ